MKTCPLPFSIPMVRPTLDGTKTQTRRVAKIHRGKDCPEEMWPHAINDVVEWREQDGRWFGLMGYRTLAYADCPYGQHGDRLWVREPWKTEAAVDHLPPRSLRCGAGIYYLADGDPAHAGRYRHARFMCRWMSRIELEIVSVRLERLQEISEEDAMAEGIALCDEFECEGQRLRIWNQGEFEAETAVGAYQQLWEKLNGADSWAANPLVWVIEFQRLPMGGTP